MSDTRGSILKKLCPGCERVQPPDFSEPLCPACGAKLVDLRAAVDDLIGTVIDDRFELRGRLGKGGMGTVYRAWQKSIGREVAVKLIDPQYAGDEMVARRFLREARLASELSHPNTVAIIDFGQAKDGRLFIAMELVRGRTLQEVRSAERAFTVGRAARIGVQLCDAVEAAHRLNIVHRDLKPSNIVVLDDPPGRDLIKVLDFGLAKNLDAPDSGEAAGGNTKSGLVVGTPQFMAPEITAGGRPSTSSDLYALGVILAELTLGQDLFDAQSTGQLLAQKTRGAPRQASVPPSLKPIVDRLISPSPSARHPSASALREALLPLVDSTETVTAAAAPENVHTKATAQSPVNPTETTPGRAARLKLLSTTPARPRGLDPEAPAPSPRRLPIAIAGVVLLLGVGAAVLLPRHVDVEESGPVASPSAPSPIVQPEPPKPTAVVVQVRTKPAGATLTLDGAQAGVAPLPLTLTKGRRVEIAASFEGRTVTQQLTPEQDQELELTVPEPLPAREEPRPPQNQKKQPRPADALPF